MSISNKVQTPRIPKKAVSSNYCDMMLHLFQTKLKLGIIIFYNKRRISMTLNIIEELPEVINTTMYRTVYTNYLLKLESHLGLE